MRGGGEIGHAIMHCNGAWFSRRYEGARWCVYERVRSRLATEKAAAFRRPRRVAAAAVPEAAPPIRRRLRPRFYTPRARRRGDDDALSEAVPVFLCNEQVTTS